MDISEAMGEMTAQLCATVSMMFNTLAGSSTKLSGMKWVPQQGWAYSEGSKPWLSEEAAPEGC
jgi:roadblock/LC7 domain-containing protein